VTAGVYQQRVTGLYDWLSRFNLLMNVAMFGRMRADLTMHKTLRVPEALAEQYAGPERRLYINDLALEAASLPREPRVLDAGCGFGGTVLRWQPKTGGTFDGFTVSRVQWTRACREAKRRGLDNQCRFHLRSYDEPIQERYDAVVSIEALVHSQSFPDTLRNLAQALKPQGKLVIVEDIPLDHANGDRDLDLLRQYWGLSAVPTSSSYRVALAANGLRVIHDRDYSEGFQTMPPERIAQLEKRYRRIRGLMPLEGPRFVVDAFLGGLALERLYQKKLVQYRLLVAHREN
jgi:SAM-dependent methyltransferase